MFQIYMIDVENLDPEQHFEDILKLATKFEYIHSDYTAEDSSETLSFVNKIKFDPNEKYIIGYGGTKVFVLNF